MRSRIASSGSACTRVLPDPCSITFVTFSLSSAKLPRKLSVNPLAVELEHVVNNTRDLWDELRGERIFIAGGTGFFGCWLLESFLWANDRLHLDCQATVLSRSPGLFHAKAPHLADHKAVSL